MAQNLNGNILQVASNGGDNVYTEKSFRFDDNKFKFTLRKNTIEIIIPQEAFYLEGIQVAKRGIAFDLKKFIPKIDLVKFIEIFKAESKTKT